MRFATSVAGLTAVFVKVVWDDAALDKFLTSPTGFVHGTKMFLSIPNSTDRQNVIAYLDTLK
jgi:cytochrome c